MTKRKELKAENPQLKNTEISRILGGLWRDTEEGEKKPFIEREEKERENYKERMSAWRKKKSKDDQIKKKKETERTQQALAERAQEEKVTSAEVNSISDVAVHDDATFTTVETSRQYQRSDNFPHQNYQQISPLHQHGTQYVDNHQYGNDYHQYGRQQQQASWPAPEACNYQHLMRTPYRSTQSHQQMEIPEAYSNSFDVFYNHQDLEFSEQNSFYDHRHQRSIKYEDEADSPYFHNEEFDPVPINHG